MEINNLLRAKLKLAQRILRELIHNYRELNDTQRMEKSNAIMDEVNSYLQIKENLLFPFMRKKGLHDDLIARSALVDTEINKLTEFSIMMHVDEPSGEYYRNMVTLLGLLDQVERVDSESVFSWVKQYLDEEDQYYIATHLKKQMTHESMPSSGIHVY
jgi:hypothetical protein